MVFLVVCQVDDYMSYPILTIDDVCLCVCTHADMYKSLMPNIYTVWHMLTIIMVMMNC